MHRATCGLLAVVLLIGILAVPESPVVESAEALSQCTSGHEACVHQYGMSEHPCVTVTNSPPRSDTWGVVVVCIPMG